MRKEEFDRITKKHPFQPFEVRLGDGRKYRFHSPEEYIVSNSAIFTLDKHGDGMLISLTLISTVHFRNGRARKGA